MLGSVTNASLWYFNPSRSAAVQLSNDAAVISESASDNTARATASAGALPTISLVDKGVQFLPATIALLQGGGNNPFPKDTAYISDGPEFQERIGKETASQLNNSFAGDEPVGLPLDVITTPGPVSTPPTQVKQAELLGIPPTIAPETNHSQLLGLPLTILGNSNFTDNEDYGNYYGLPPAPDRVITAIELSIDEARNFTNSEYGLPPETNHSEYGLSPDLQSLPISVASDDDSLAYSTASHNSNGELNALNTLQARLIKQLQTAYQNASLEYLAQLTNGDPSAAHASGPTSITV